MHALRHLRSRIVAFGHDVAVIPLAWLGAYWIRYNLGEIPAPFMERALQLLPLVVFVQAIIFWYFGLYRGIWRFASMPDFVRIGKAVLAGAALCSILFFLLVRMQYVPRSAWILYVVLLSAMLGVPRLAYRWLKDHKLREVPGRRTLIVGSGQAAEMLIRDLFRHQAHGYLPVALVDDSPRRQGREIHGVRVVGTVDDVPRVVSELNVELVLIAIPSVTSRQMRRVVESCGRSGVAVRTLPRLEDLVSGQVTVSELREVFIEDLLGREPVNLEWAGVRSAVQDQVVLVTGGAGSIGSELCRQIARLRPNKLVVFDKSEFGLFSIQQQFQTLLPSSDLVLRLGDICDTSAVDAAFRAYRPSLVFHAAAYKHVPMLETHAREAVHNNVLGTRNVIAAAKSHACDTFVFISTDKAVNPTSIMGASKRVAEILCQEAARQGSTRFVTVRFGNVLGSAGSVVPLFRDQILSGGPVTVTHPEVTRFFMTISEASQLILQAAALEGSDAIYVLDMGEPIEVRYLAEQMIRLSGKIPGEDIEVVYTGLRPGEKLYEELFHGEETLSATAHQKILKADHRPQNRSALSSVLERMEAACLSYDVQAIEALFAQLVPEFRGASTCDSATTVVPFNTKKS